MTKRGLIRALNKAITAGADIWQIVCIVTAAQQNEQRRERARRIRAMARQESRAA